MGDVLSFEAFGDSYVVAAFKDKSLKIFHAASGELKHTVIPESDTSKEVQSLAFLDSPLPRLLCGHHDGQITVLEVSNVFAQKASWHALERTSITCMAQVPTQLAARLGCDVRGLFLLGSYHGGVQLWQHVSEVAEDDDDL